MVTVSCRAAIVFTVGGGRAIFISSAATNRTCLPTGEQAPSATSATSCFRTAVRLRIGEEPGEEAAGTSAFGRRQRGLFRELQDRRAWKGPRLRLSPGDVG